ncbi:MAG: hypothetical protein ACI81A_002879, partial [Paraglaciecola sp.]
FTLWSPLQWLWVQMNNVDSQLKKAEPVNLARSCINTFGWGA